MCDVNVTFVIYHCYGMLCYVMYDIVWYCIVSTFYAVCFFGVPSNSLAVLTFSSNISFLFDSASANLPSTSSLVNERRFSANLADSLSKRDAISGLPP